VSEPVFSVSQINEYLNRKLWKDPFLSSVSVVGEVTNFSMSSVGHAFFSLKDEDSMINCVMHDFFDNDDSGVVSDGALIQISGRIVFYRKTGTVQFIAEKASLQGVGDLFAQFERTKKKLYNEGIFDISHKKPLLEFPLHLGVVTSSAGAVMHDIIVIATRRFEGINITVYPVQVQGQDAARQICEGIRHFNDTKNVDVIIVGRGGGSFEDLFAFNEESVARAVYESEIPVVSAVGHETDYTLCDMAADLRAPTPSAAAELVVKEKQALVEYLSKYKKALRQSLLALAGDHERRISLLKSIIKSYPFDVKLQQAGERIAADRGLMKASLVSVTERYKLMLDRFTDNLESLNPRNVLKRGYAIVYDKDQRVVASKINATADMDIEFSDGRVAVTRKD
jgi:exodeoxyribonuclease VII large subunit